LIAVRVLGISCDYHDSAACVVEDGSIVAAAQEERFSRLKFDASFPAAAIRYCLAEAGGTELDAVAFYEKPLRKLHRILETSVATAPRGLRVLASAAPGFLREKLWIEPRIHEALRRSGVVQVPGVYFPAHHLSHAASAFYPSPFDRAAIVTLDGVGEWTTGSIALGAGAGIEMLEEMRFPDSLGLLYAAFTAFCGFRVNSGEHKLMGLAPFGEPRYRDLILSRLVDLKEDGSFRLDLSSFGYLDSPAMTNSRFADLFGGPARKPEQPLTRREADLARSIQEVTDEIVVRVARHAHAITGERRLCLAGGVALNCVANGRVVRERIFDAVWIQPAAGDAGAAVGAAYAALHMALGAPRSEGRACDEMQASYLGPEFSTEQLRAFLAATRAPHEVIEDDEAWAGRIAGLIAEGKIIALFQGRMEFGPRALGNRSILADPRSPRTQSILNLRTKRREGFRPFAPSVLAERAADYFDLDQPSPYMMICAPVRLSRRTAEIDDRTSEDLVARVQRVRSDIPAVTHVDWTSRIQTVEADANPRFHALLRAFEARTGCAVLVNTSFNVRGEPIVCTPDDAYRCFMDTEIDALTLGPFVLHAEQQPGYSRRGTESRTFAPD
jgi:carbamoyltransferase